jgi:UDP-N-acetylmuramyl pentapeptide phosphotransferase/UDP-N-acetylglucosamine-1-phosphate transferase
MESTAPRGVDLSARTTHPVLALILAILSIPGSTMAWDLFDGAGFVIGVPLAIAAIVLAVQARAVGNETGKATAAIVIAGAMLAMTAVWTLVSVISG